MASSCMWSEADMASLIACVRFFFNRLRLKAKCFYFRTYCKIELFLAHSVSFLKTSQSMTSIFIVRIIQNLNTLCGESADLVSCHSRLYLFLSLGFKRLSTAKEHWPHQFVPKAKESRTPIIQFCWDGECSGQNMNIYLTTFGFQEIFNESL